MDAGAARLPVPGTPNQHEHPLVIELPVLLDRHPPIIEGVNHQSPAFAHTRHPGPPLPSSEPADDHELDLGVGPLKAAEVAPLPLGVDRAHQVEVSSRHPPASIHLFGCATARRHPLRVPWRECDRPCVRNAKRPAKTRPLSAGRSCCAAERARQGGYLGFFLLFGEAFGAFPFAFAFAGFFFFFGRFGRSALGSALTVGPLVAAFGGFRRLGREPLLVALRFRLRLRMTLRGSGLVRLALRPGGARCSDEQ